MNKNYTTLLLSSALLLVLSGCGGEKKEENGLEVSEGIEVGGPDGSDGSSGGSGYEGNAGASELDSEEVTNVAAFFAKDKNSTPVHFAFDTSRVRANDKANLDRLVALMQQAPGLNVTFEGHCDSRGTKAYNMGLGQRRADAAMRYVASMGVSRSRMNVMSFGKERPVAMGEDSQAWAANRRVVVRVVQ